ncbi:VOC family protein [Staphylococcus simiae]|uniref:VOC family protein n=1 Tax=Staphylococcus simiae TaxID=308354 RepID=UPI001A962ABC|nr:VOC family protein [Staphylococcus simiae]MBO1197906.1 VOC family protein [Staphylococcus simiae]MBO1200097.1 VOC family protein [Staphylococcus simiae]MBO1202370.1 VOC family protein [Staphylococcus simiae]MBO1209897.1 VOC family protein [Staphylococcus simiae]MBO1228514.1 VOC family protein [Staphylococcus simiae]
MDKLNQVMLYVDNVEQAKLFWTETLNFVIISETNLVEDYKAIEVAPTTTAETSLSIMSKEFIEKYSPEVNLGTPSLMFKETHFDALYEKLKSLNLTGHDVIEMNGARVFNFQDGQGNYFAVSD